MITRVVYRDCPTTKLPAAQLPRPVTFEWLGRGFLRLNDAVYRVSEQQFEYENGMGGRLWDLRKPDGTTYRITLNADGDLACDCPDAIYRGREHCCKHVRGLRAALLHRDRADRLAAFLAPVPEAAPF
jgi:hypothetical protein